MGLQTVDTKIIILGAILAAEDPAARELRRTGFEVLQFSELDA